MPIEIIDTPGLIYETQSVSSSDWRLVPPNVFIYWMFSQPTPQPFSQRIFFPRYDTIEGFTEYTSWQFETSIYFSSSIAFLQVENSSSNIGDLGTPAVVDGALMYTKELSFSFANLNLLSEGQYLPEVLFKVTAINPVTGVREVISEKNLFVEFWANSFTFSLNPPVTFSYQSNLYTFSGPTNYAPIVFDYYQNGPMPNVVDFFYYSLPSTMSFWTMVSSDAVLETNLVGMHPYFSRFQIFFGTGINSLAVGVYNYTLALYRSGNLIATIPVKLNVYEEISTSLHVTPNPIEFNLSVGSANPVPVIVNVISDAPWYLNGQLPAWLSISQASGEGNSTLLLSVINYMDMMPGRYDFVLLFQSGVNSFEVNVQLNLKFFLHHSFQSNKLSFTKELDFLNFQSNNPNTFIEITMKIKIFKINDFSPLEYTRKYNLPLYKGHGVFHPGSVVHELLDTIDNLEYIVPDVENNYSKSQYKPAEINISYEEKSYPGIVTIELSSGVIEVFRMIKGHKSFVTNSQLALLTIAQQEYTRITPGSPVIVSFSHFGTPQILVKVNNQVIDDVIITGFPDPNLFPKVLYSFFRFMNGVNVGDVLEIMIVNGTESRTQRYLVMNPGPAKTFFIFENDNGLPEVFEFSGRRRINSTFTHTMNSKFKNLYSYDQKVNSKNIQPMTVNTGQLLPSDIKVINALIKSSRAWCSLDSPNGPYFEVDAVSERINYEDTNHGEIGYDIEFNILEDTDAILYPRN